VALAWAEVGRGLISLLLGGRALLLQHKQSFGARFLIVCIKCGYEVLVRDSSCCELFRKLSLNLIRVSMSNWRLVEHKGSAASCFYEQ
jgi:hypothetical protein